MNVDDSTPDANPSELSTEITPPVPPQATGAVDLRTKDQLLASLQSEVRMLRTRVDALEAERRRFAQPTTTDPVSTPSAVSSTAGTATSGATATSNATDGSSNSSSATPMWRTKTGKQAGWQPSRR